MAGADLRMFLAALGMAASTPAVGSQAVAPPAGQGAEAFGARAARIDQMFSALAAKGGSYIVRYDLDGRSFEKGYGHLDCGRTKPMPANALIDSGSLTKTFTAAAIYKLVEEGRLRLDDPISLFIPNVPADKRQITVAQLVSHRSGLPDFMTPDGRILGDGDYDIEMDYLPISKQQMLKLGLGAKLLFKPGTEERYSNFGYQFLAAIVEKASRRDYESYVRDKILLPAGMNDTGYRLPDFAGKVIADQCMDGSSWKDPVTKGLWTNRVSWFLLGAGGMMTTAADLQRWTAALAGGKLFRADIRERFRRGTFFQPSYGRCKSEVMAVSGSNALTFASILFLPLRKESLIAISTRSDHAVPGQETLDVLCPR